MVEDNCINEKPKISGDPSKTCIFCKIIAGEIPCYKVFENDELLAFLDISPRNKGHTLLVPKKHSRWVWDMQEEYSKVSGQIANALKKAFSTDYVVSFVMGEEVHHAHLHLVPRFEGDGHGPLVDLKAIKEVGSEEMQAIAAKIAGNL